MQIRNWTTCGINLRHRMYHTTLLLIECALYIIHDKCFDEYCPVVTASSGCPVTRGPALCSYNRTYITQLYQYLYYPVITEPKLPSYIRTYIIRIVIIIILQNLH